MHTPAHLDWPSVPGYAMPENLGGFAVHPTCVVAYNDGSRQIGALLHFTPRDGVIEIHTRGATSPRRVALAELKSLHLTQLLQPVPPDALPDAPHSALSRQAATPTSARREHFELEFLDGEPMSGETHGFVAADRGLFLFVANPSGTVTRFFAPNSSLKSLRVGERVGRFVAAPRSANDQTMRAGPASMPASMPASRAASPAAFPPLSGAPLPAVPLSAAPMPGAPLPAAPRSAPSAAVRGPPNSPTPASDITTAEDLAHALAAQKSAPWLKLGDALVQARLITPEQLAAALAQQTQGRKLPLGDILVEMQWVDRRTLNGMLARQFGIPLIDLAKFHHRDRQAGELLPAEICRRHRALPLYLAGASTLVVAMEDPISREPLQELAFFSRRKIQPVMAMREDIERELDAVFGAGPAAAAERAVDRPLERTPDRRTGERPSDRHSDRALERTAERSGAELASQLATDEPTPEIAEAQVGEADSAIVRLVNKMILEAIEQGASDIHIEAYPGRQNTLVRLRKDGTLVPHLEVPAAYRSAFVSRIKIMCQLDISEKRKPQDGKIEFRKFGPANVELRVATIPTTHGLEDIVMRVLAAGKPIPLAKLDLSPNNLRQVTAMSERPHGLLLVCGPTGSGKTTTLHSVLNHVNVPGRKIWTAEDPIEITQAGLRQVQVNPRIGWTFAAAMRTFLRADPDIIMLGEIRDAETAQVAIQGSLTGHLVLSTLHTNSAPESIVRLLDLGADPFNFADALLAVLAQRLAKRLCTSCRAPHTASTEDIEALLDEYCHGLAWDRRTVLRDWQARFADEDGQYTLYTAVGCKACNQTGYRGRIGLHELFVNSEATRRLIQTRGVVADLLAAASAEGMRTLRQDGIEKTLMGLTDLAQTRAVCG